MATNKVKWIQTRTEHSLLNSGLVPPSAITINNQLGFLSLLLSWVWDFAGVPWGNNINFVLLSLSENLSNSEQPWTVPSIYFPRVDIKEDSLFKYNPLCKSLKSHLTQPTLSSSLPWLRVLAEAPRPGWGWAFKSDHCCHLLIVWRLFLWDPGMGENPSVQKLKKKKNLLATKPLQSSSCLLSKASLLETAWISPYIPTPLCLGQ